MRRKPELDGRPLAFSNLPHDATVDVPAGVERYVDVVSIPWIAEQQGELPIRLEIREPFPANQAEWLTPGAWRLRLEVAAENVSAQEVELVIRFDGAWPADPPERIWDAVSIQGPVKPGSIAAPRAPLLLGPQQQLEQALAADEEAEDG